MLTRKGFREVYNLKDGMIAWEVVDGPEACGPVETPLQNGFGAMNEMLIMAYKIEEVLESFYSMMASFTKNARIIPELIRLIGDEKNHKLEFSIWLKVTIQTPLTKKGLQQLLKFIN